MDFSEALTALKAGERVTRERWLEGVFITLMPGYPEGIGINAATAKATRLPEGTLMKFYPYILLVEGTEGSTDWAHDTDDLLADDWMIHETSAEATAEILADPQAMADIAEAEAELARDEAALTVRERLGRAALEDLIDSWRREDVERGGPDTSAWKVVIVGRTDLAGTRISGIQTEALPELDEETVSKFMLNFAKSMERPCVPVERPVWRTPGYREAVAALVAGTINHHILGTCRGVEACEGCCPNSNCCGPCSALAWFRDNANEAITIWLQEWDPDGDWSWQNPDGSINWADIEAHWKPDLGCRARHEPRLA